MVMGGVIGRGVVSVWSVACGLRHDELCMELWTLTVAAHSLVSVPRCCMIQRVRLASKSSS